MLSCHCQEETLKSNPQFLLQASDHSGKVLNDPVQSQHIPVAPRPDSLSLPKLHLGTAECLLMPPNFIRVFCVIYLRTIIATYRRSSFKLLVSVVCYPDNSIYFHTQPEPEWL